MRDRPTINEALTHARARVDSVDARVLLQHALDVDRTYLATHADAELSAEQAAAYTTLIARRSAGEPVAYLVGAREFYGLRLRVTPAVLIPRPETELVVDLALAKLAHITAPRVLDLGTGSGAIAVAIAALRADAYVLGVDRSASALAVAQENARALLGADAARVEWRQSDWYAAVGGERFDAILSNPPYIAAGDPHLARGDLRFEPQQALVGGGDGLDDIRIIVAAATAHLKTGGWLIFEHGYDQAARCRELLRSASFGAVESAKDLAGIERVTVGRYN
jgi:release factor glutamine methyltransferase